MKKLAFALFAGLAVIPARAGTYIQQSTFPVAATTIAGLGRDLVGNLYVLGLTAGATTYRVTGYQTQGISPQFSFDTGVSTFAAFAVEDSGIVDILDVSNGFTLKRFTNTGAFISQSTFSLNTSPYVTPVYLSAAIDKADHRVYLTYQITNTVYRVLCLGCTSGPSSVTYGFINQYDFNGNQLLSTQMSGTSNAAGSCYTPSIMATDPQGNLYVADPNCQKVVEYSLAGAQTGVVPASWVTNFQPRGMWTDSSSNLYISEPVCGPAGCSPGVVKLAGGSMQTSFVADSVVGCAWDPRILYMSSSGSLPLRRFIFDGAPTVPPEVAPLNSTAQHSAAAALAWQAAGDPDGDPIAYSVYLGASPSQLVLIGTTTQTSLTTQPLTFGVTYYWQVVAGDSYLGLPLQQTPAPVVSFNLGFLNNPPGAFSVAGGTGTFVTRATAMTLAWQAAIDPDGDPVLYDVSWRPAAQSSATIITTVNTSLTMTGLSFATTYYWSVLARDPYGASTPMTGGAQALQLVFKNSPPSAAGYLTAPSYSFHTSSPSVDVSWLPSTDPDGDPVAYQLDIKTSTGAWSPLALGAATSFPLSVQYETTYYYRVDAVDPYGGVSTGAWTSVIAHLANRPPNQIVYTSANSVTTRAASYVLTWQDTGDPDGDPVTYNLYLSTDPSALALFQQGTQTSYTLALQFGTTVYWRVSATDNFGAHTDGPLQVFLPVFKNSPPPAPPVAAGSGVMPDHTFTPQAQLAWSAVLDPDGDPVTYQFALGLSSTSLTLAQIGTQTSYALQNPAFGTTYYWQVSAIDPYGAASTSPVQSLRLIFQNNPPGPFSVLTGTGTLSTRATSQPLAWNPSMDPDGDTVTYALSLSTTPGAATVVQQSTATSYTLNFQFGTTYYWSVAAFDGFGGTTTITGGMQSFLPVFKNSPPPAPTAVMGTGVIYEHTLTPQAQLTWSAVQDPDGDPVSYRLSVGLSTSSLSLAQVGTLTSFALPSPSFGTTYYWQVAAVDPYGAAGISPVQSLLLGLQNNPPGGFAATAGTGTVTTRLTSTSLAWSGAIDPDGDVVTYSLSLSTTPGAATVVQQSTATSYTLSFQFGTTYYWSVAAYDGFGGSTTISGGTQSLLTVFKNSPPTVPVNQSKTGTTPYHGFAPLQAFFWQASTDPDGDPFTYSLYYGTDSSHLAVLSPVPLGFTLPNLPLNTAYFYRIIATDIYGASSDSPLNWVFYQFTDNPPGPFDVLGTTGTISTRDTTANLSWTPSVDPDGDPVTYRVYTGTMSAALAPLLDTTKTSTVLTNLAFATTYYWRVDAYDGFGATTTVSGGAQSLLHLFYNTAPPAPTVTSGAGVLPQHALTPQAHLSWTAVQDQDGDPVSYQLYVGVSSNSLAAVQLSSPTAYDLAAPQFGTTYYWQVAAADPFGAASTTPVQSLLLTFQNNPPGAFAVLTGTGTLASRTTSELLSWGSSTDPDGDVVTYALSLSTTPGGLAVVQSSTATSYALGFQFGTTYYWNVSAFDGFGGTTTIAGGTQSFFPVFLNHAPQVVQLIGASPTISTMFGNVTVSWSQVTTPQNDPVTYTVSLGDSASGLEPIAQIGQTGQAGATALSLRPMKAKPQTQAVVNGNTITLTLTGLDYYRTYYLTIQASNPYGATSVTPVQTFTLASANGFPLAYNYPNPFSPARGGTNIVFNAPPSGYARATVSVYSELGDLLFNQDYANVAPGISQFPFAGRDRYGRPLFNGSYVCRVRFEGPDDRATFYLLVVK